MSMSTNHGYPWTDHNEAWPYNREHGDVLTSSDSKPTRILLLLYTYRYCLLLLIVLRRTSWNASISAAHALNYRPACMERLPHKDILGVNADLCPQTGKIMHTHVYIYSRRCRVYKTCMFQPALFTENILKLSSI